ncbi:hypothetical protein [Aureispira anguillae]|uniref:Uncharacterized protein n=1 Tax=Aureispira anguillae TaxID=2864201 RepID=A0A915YGF9_9BACT|nr:hypothetical protein [Aureispira anguillae]BDS12638.1 hypothetical protein AsAng_0033620 [Aureispira anguillae]
MKKITALLFFLLSLMSQLLSQNNVGIGTNSPDSSAILELEATNKGLLIPRMSTLQRLAISSPANGLMILDTTLQRFTYYDAITQNWMLIDVVGGDPHNSLDQAYDQGGAGAGKKILVDAGAVELEGNGTADNLDISNAGNKTGIKIHQVGTGSGIKISNTPNVPNTNDLIYSSSNGSSNTNIRLDGGRAGHFKNTHSGNNKPTLEAKTLGTGHAVLGLIDSLPATTDPIPVAGVAGVSLTNRHRNGVTGLSRDQNGVWGKTLDTINWNSDPTTTFNAGVMGVGADGFGSTTGTSDPFIGVTGMAQKGTGILGLNIGEGPGIIGISKATSSPTEAGIWGMILDTNWTDHSSEYPLYGSPSTPKGQIAILGQTNTNPAIWGESKGNIGVIGTTGKKRGKADLPTLKAGILGNATETDDMAAFFRTEGATLYPTIFTLSNSSESALKISNKGTGIGIHIAQQDPDPALGVAAPNATHALFAENHGMGIAAELKNEHPMNPSPVFISSTLGLGSTALFHTLKNAGNTEPTVAILNNSNGAGALILIEDSTASPSNPAPALHTKTNGLGTSACFEILNTHTTPGKENIEPAMSAYTKGMGNAGRFKLDNPSNAAAAVFVEQEGIGHGLDIESSNGAAESLVHIEQSGTGSGTTKGSVAHFELSNTTSSPTSEAVLITSNNPNPVTMPSSVLAIGTTPPAVHAALRVHPASSSHMAATFEGHAEVAGKLVVGGEILCPSVKIGALSVIGGMTAGGGISSTGPVTGTFKAFRIDHPLDPQNKYMYHASIESDEFMNIYSGKITTNHQGLATIKLPNWMTTLNRDFRYQLTVLGKTFSKAIVWEEMDEAGQFIIKTELPNVQVSWQVSGIRQDVYARENPLQVEVEKEKTMKGKLIYQPKLN